MKFRGMIFFVILFFSQLAHSQEETKVMFQKNKDNLSKQNSISLKSRNITFEKEDFKTDFTKDKHKKRLYFKLRQSLTSAIKNKLSKYNVALSEYVANDTYVIEIDEAKLNSIRKLGFIQGFAEINPADKMSERVYKKNFSDYAKDGNSVKVVVSFYEDVTYNDAVSLIRSVAGTVESEKFSRTHKLLLSIHKDNLINLVSLDIVKYVDEIPPPLIENNIAAGRLSEVFWDDLSGLYDTPYSLTGSGINVAVRDGGKIFGHTDFSGRLNIVDNDWVSDHATHVAGTIGATNRLYTTPKTGSMAPNVNLYSYSFFIVGTNQNQQEASFADDFVSAIENYNVSIISNSWGHIIGWYRKPNGQWTTDYSAPETAFGIRIITITAITTTLSAGAS